MTDARRLTSRFLLLPYRKQWAILKALDLLPADAETMTDADVFREAFARAQERGLVPELDRLTSEATDT